MLLRNVSFDLLEGQIISVLGASGCGKSTLLKLILAEYARSGKNDQPDGLRPASGTIAVTTAGTRKGGGGLSYVTQSPELIPWRTALQNATIDGELLSLDDSSVLLRIKSDFQKFGLEGAEDRFPEELSGGMIQRIAVIRALSTMPSIICADEPFSALDYFTRIHANSLFRERCSLRRVASVFVTHNIEEAVYLSEKILVIHKAGGAGYTLLDVPRRREWEADPIAFRQSDEFRDTIRMVWHVLEGEIHE